MKNLFSEEPYSPINGINPDGNGISIALTEAPWMQNLRPQPSGIKTREGFRGMADFINPMPLLHTHYLSNSQVANSKLFGFSQRFIWEYVPGDNPYWKPLFKDWVAMGFDETANTPFLGASGIVDLIGAYTQMPIYPAFWLNSPLTSWKFNPALTYSAGDWILFDATRNSPQEAITLDVTFSVAGLQSFSGEKSPFGSGRVFLFRVPLGDSIISFTFRDPDGVEITGGIVNTFIASFENQYVFDCSFFSSVEILDDDGLKLIVAGSNPPEHGRQETDSGSRVLLEYAGSTWAAKVIKQQWSVGREGTGISTTGTNFTDATIPNEMTAGDRIIPGLVTFFTLTDGEICRASAIEDSGGAGKYQLYSNDGYVNESTSWVGEDGKWYIALTTAGVAKFFPSSVSQLVFMDYSYSTPFEFKPRHLSAFAGRLVVGGTYEDSNYYPWRVRSSYVGNSDLFIEYDYYDLLDYGLETIECFKQLGSSLFAYTREGLYRGYVLQDGNLSFQSFWAGGTVCGRSVSVFNNLHFFIGSNDIYKFDGSSVQSITLREGHTRVKNYLYSQIDSDNYLKFFSFFYAREKEVWFFVKTSGVAYPTDCYVYNIDRQTWTFFKFPETLSFGHYIEERYPTWDDLGTLTWDDLQVTWDELGTISSRSSVILSFYQTGAVVIVDPNLATENYFRLSGQGFSNLSGGDTIDDINAGLEGTTLRAFLASSTDSTLYGIWDLGERTAIPFRLISRDFVYSSLERKDRTLIVDFESRGAEVTFGIDGDFSMNPATFQQLQVIQPDSTYSKKSYHPDFYDYAARILIQGSGLFDLRWMQPKAKVFKHKGET
jgi:hypothetical protein